MSAKPIDIARLAGAVAAALSLSSICRPAPCLADKPPPPVVIVLFADALDTSKDAQPDLQELRGDLRADPRLEVLTFNSEAPTFLVAASQAKIDIDHVDSDETRAALARALGADLTVTVAPAKHKKHVDVTVRVAGTGSGQIPQGVSSEDESIEAAAQLVTEQALVVQAARDLKSSSIVRPPAAPATEPASVAPPRADVSPVSSAPTAAEATVVPTAQAPVPPASPQGATASAPMSSRAAIPPASAPSMQHDQAASAASAPEVKPRAPVAGLPAPAETPSAPSAPEASLPPASAPTHESVKQTSAPRPVVIEQPLAKDAAAPAPVNPAAPTSVTPGRLPDVTATPAQPIPHHIVSATPEPGPYASPQATPALPSEPTTDSALIVQPTAVSVSKPTPVDADTQNFLTLGDQALAKSDTQRSIEEYRHAIDESPRNVLPRIKLAQAYLAAGQQSDALDEVRRAGEIEPQSSALAQFLDQESQSGNLPGADTVLLQMKAASTPNDTVSLLKLGDSYWNSNHLEEAEQTYTAAAQAGGSDPQPYARLARLYAATERYDECLVALSHSGDQGYPAALRIIVQRADNLMGDMDTELQGFQANQSTRTQFYSEVKKTDQQTENYSAFIARIVAPTAYKVSYLHRRLAANLLSQVTPALENFSLTGDQQYLDQAKSIEHSAEQELTMANVADKLQKEVLSGG